MKINHNYWLVHNYSHTTQRAARLEIVEIHVHVAFSASTIMLFRHWNVMHDTCSNRIANDLPAFLTTLLKSTVDLKIVYIFDKFYFRH